MVDHGVKNGSVVNLHANFLGKVREIYMMQYADYSDNDDDDLNPIAREEHVVLSPHAQNMHCLSKIHNRMPHISYYL